MIKSLSLLVFSPTGTTKRIVTLIGNSLAEKVTQCNLMLPSTEKYTFGENDFLVVGVPVYGGRVPETALKAIQRFSGANTPAVSIVVYGNRAYDDALLELNDTLQANGFRILASGAFVGRHSIVESIGKNRPDDEDRVEIEEFAERVLEKFTRYGKTVWDDLPIPGNRPYKEYKPAPIAPYSNQQCTKCGLCITECPVDAIAANYSTDESKCILCMRCVNVCPRKARLLPEEYKAKVSDYLTQVCPERNENVVFI